MLRNERTTLLNGQELRVTWSVADTKRIREAAKDIGVTAECLVQYAVEEVLEASTFTKAIARTPCIEDARKLDAKDIIGSCDQEDGP